MKKNRELFVSYLQHGQKLNRFMPVDEFSGDYIIDFICKENDSQNNKNENDGGPQNAERWKKKCCFNYIIERNEKKKRAM